MQSYAGLLEPVWSRGGGLYPYQILDDNSTVSQSGKGQVTIPTPRPPPEFQTFLQPWYVCNVTMI